MLQTKRCVVIPDLHEDLAWADGILAREAAAGADFVVFLGDYFDSLMRWSMDAEKSRVCDWLMGVRRAWEGRCLFLLGNHDIQYLEVLPAADRQPGLSFYRCGSAFSAPGARSIAESLPAEFWAEARLFAVVNGYLLSHAGLSARLWPGAGEFGLEQALGELQGQCERALQSVGRASHPLLEAGRVRGGSSAVGGITWLDWDEEFEDDLPLPQIVGHTGDNSGARRRGRSWCLDGRQTCYGVLTPHGLEIAAHMR